MPVFSWAKYTCEKHIIDHTFTGPDSLDLETMNTINLNQIQFVLIDCIETAAHRLLSL